MRIAIIGESGQLARALIRRCAENHIDAQSYSRQDIDLSNSENLIEAFVSKLKVDAVIIAAAYTAVDAAEDDFETALAVNAHAPAAVARACSKCDIALVHVSTDYVFKGKANLPYPINAATDPVNAYGRSKLAGEQAVLNAHKRAAILRTSWVFDGGGKNFMTTMLRLAEMRNEVSVVKDQMGRPTYAGHLAQACLKTAQALLADDFNDAAGIYHVSGNGPPISWADFAVAIFKHAKHDLAHNVNVKPIPSSDHPTPAARPAYSVLDLTRYETQHGALPDWSQGLEQAHAEWLTLRQ